ncbi:hypothetical protein L2E82_15038 [Cichorium intybus]|uniref:Uncharacterized protein n=1 Tax=Cichorium intybus TaxID=13427 RepID=A0ACB9F1N4_CICIN|nr:hypothetical protein L2E82_15038 [Cichorium intybus]
MLQFRGDQRRQRTTPNTAAATNHHHFHLCRPSNAKLFLVCDFDALCVLFGFLMNINSTLHPLLGMHDV